MNRDRRGVVVVTAAALALLLPACATTPKPEGRVQTWSYAETRLPPYWWAALVDIGGARGRGATGAERRIAILDTGVLPGQEDLANVSPGTATCGANSGDTTDTNGHGTQLAGIAAGSARLPTMTGWTNSTATCCASVLAPPVPNTTSLPRGSSRSR